MTPAAFLAALAMRVDARLGPGVLRIGIDGVDGAGKTTLADRLGEVLEARGIAVIRASIDGFHNPRVKRYARGRGSPEGFFRDSFDLAAVRHHLLDPLAAKGSGRYRRAVFDHRTDAPVSMEPEVAPRKGVLVFDGIFLHRPELKDAWDLSIFLDVPFEMSFARMAERDGSDPNPDAPASRRYRLGQELYFRECEPRRAADILVDYADVANPRIIRG